MCVRRESPANRVPRARRARRAPRDYRGTRDAPARPVPQARPGQLGPLDHPASLDLLVHSAQQDSRYTNHCIIICLFPFYT